MSKNSRKIYLAAWLVTILLILVDLIWAYRVDFRIEKGSLMQSARMLSVVFAVALAFWLISRIPYKVPARKAFYENVAHSLQWIAVLAVFTHVALVFQYLCVTTNFPLVGDALVAVDAALGFHWLEIYRWVTMHHWMHAVLGLAYVSGDVQLLAIPVILAITSNSRDYAEFVVQFIVSVIVSILISVFLPAESAFLHFNIQDPGTVSTVSDFARLRSGAAREVIFASAQGLISFPSLHVMLALSFAYSLRHVRFVFPIGIALNALMIVSTPTQGGHYLSDVLSGLVIGVLVIYVVRIWFAGGRAPGVRRASRRRTRAFGMDAKG
ncbi:PAP2 family protein [Burkholderia stabilis]|uniref:PAP2 family protein n=1 Tax=Burkholderia stabilis TaxID=95485 RepID=A0A4Q2AH38_9BURK|nr:phosphatase PAP2 family protein [Burkholderia stabilis]RXV69272.1 PAP2 family protein [Burkholderia stabilis]